MKNEQLREECVRLENLMRSEDKSLWDNKNVASAYSISILQVPALLNRIAELERDAARYRWLRDHAGDDWEVTEELPNGLTQLHLLSGDLDAAIDAAMQEQSDKLTATQTKEGGK